MREAAQNACFEGKVEMPRIRHGSKQTLETRINEEALLLAKYFRGEREIWAPRIVVINGSSTKGLRSLDDKNGDQRGADKDGAIFEWRERKI